MSLDETHPLLQPRASYLSRGFSSPNLVQNWLLKVKSTPTLESSQASSANETGQDITSTAYPSTTTTSTKEQACRPPHTTSGNRTRRRTRFYHAQSRSYPATMVYEASSNAPTLAQRAQFTANDWITYYEGHGPFGTVDSHLVEQSVPVVDRVMLGIIKSLCVVLFFLVVAYLLLFVFVFWVY